MPPYPQLPEGFEYGGALHQTVTVEDLREAVHSLDLDMQTWEDARYPEDQEMLDGVLATALQKKQIP